VKAPALVMLIAMGATATAQPNVVEGRIAKARELVGRGEFAAARDELQAAFATEARPELLFALGQVELNLGNYPEAIAYYERFIATGPAEDQIALAQQAIGAARMRIVTPPPEAPAPITRIVERPQPVYRRQWRLENTGLVALGGAMAIASGVLFVHAGRLGDDRSGSLADYDDRVDQARTERWTGLALGVLGVTASAIAIVRWRLDRTEVRVSTSGASITASATW
jgi:tetratricopeptide (TPR) repeat protein